MNIQAPKGTRDIHGEEVYFWQNIEKIILDTCNLYNIEEIRTPVFEHTELFSRGVGDTTDIVEKEMYTFKDKGGRSISLRPEGTASVARAYVEHGLHVNKMPVKYFYNISAFRYENPQAGRFRQFHQFGIEYLGSQSPSCDAEVIAFCNSLFKQLGIKTTLNISSLGGPECRKNYNKLLSEYLGGNVEKLCPTCQDRFERNPLRVLDCKEKICTAIVKDAPSIVGSLGEDCKKHFNSVQNFLDAMGVIYDVTPSIVRGLDYYSKTVFEFFTEGMSGAICGGGRYDGLIEELGGAPTPGIGFAVGLERLVQAVRLTGISVPRPVCDIYIGSIGEEGKLLAQSMVQELRESKIVSENDIMDRSIKAQMKYADAIGARYSLIIGDNEIVSKKANVRNMKTGEEKEISFDDIFDFLKDN